jgi:hypothetical protein
MTPYAGTVIGMTKTTKQQRRFGAAAVGAAFAVATVFGPTHDMMARLGVNETVGQATVSAADTITSTAVLAEVAAAGRRVSKTA